jgi:phage gpG-like protein
MTRDSIRIEIDKESQEIIEGLFSKNLLKVKKANERIGVDHRKHIKRIFDGQESRDSDLAWPPLKRVTELYKIKKLGSVKRPLIFSGALRESLTKKGARGNISIVDDNGGTFGTNISYAKWHFMGLPNRKVKSQKQRFWLGINLGLWKNVGDKIPLPKRDPVTPNESAFNRWVKILENVIKDNFKLNKIEVS